MRYRIFLFISICIYTSCTKKMFQTEYNSDIKLIINVSTDIVFDTINITVSFENNTTSDLYLLNERFVEISPNRTSMWNLKIFFQDTIPMLTPMLINYGIIMKNDYILVKSRDKLIFNFHVDFRILIREFIPNFRKLNDDYGEYVLKLVYADPFVINKKAFRGIIESNEIKLLYKKQ